MLLWQVACQAQGRHLQGLRWRWAQRACMSCGTLEHLHDMACFKMWPGSCWNLLLEQVACKAQERCLKGLC